MAADLDLSVTSDLTFASEYVFRGVEFADNSFQPSLEASAGDFYVGLFSNLPIDQGGKNNQNEIHYYGGFSLAVPGLEMLVLDIGGTVYHWPDAGLNRTHEGFVGATFQDVGIPGVSAAAYYFYDVDRRTHVLEGSLGYSMVLDQDGLFSLDLSAFYGNQFGGSIRGGSPRVNENYDYYGASAEMPFSLNEFSTISAGVHFQTTENATLGNFGGGQLRDKNLFYTVSYTAGF